jgi:hypothetical protein
MPSRRCNSTPAELSSLINRAAAFVRRPVDYRITRQRHRTSLSPRPARHIFSDDFFVISLTILRLLRLRGKYSLHRSLAVTFFCSMELTAASGSIRAFPVGEKRSAVPFSLHALVAAHDAGGEGVALSRHFVYTFIQLNSNQ